MEIIGYSFGCTGVTYTNLQVREDPGFSLQSAGFKGRDCPLGFRKNVSGKPQVPSFDG